MTNVWLQMSAADLGRGIDQREISPVDLTQVFLDAIDANPLKKSIYARITPDRAMREATAAAKRAASGNRLSLLDGVPVSWKDLFDTAGTATEAGSALLAGRVPNQDALVLQNATAHGLVCLGKTHMSELAFSGLGYNPITQTPPSVNDPDAVAGGSSSGAATSVAYGLAAASVGSDTGGSVRIPAVWNDLVGLKTTSGRLPLKGVVPLVESFDTVGPLCRTVEDAALMLAVMAGNQPSDLKNANLKGVRLLILETDALDDVRDRPMAGFTSAVQRLQAAGALIERGTVPCVTDALALSPVLFAAEAYATWKDQIEAAPAKMYGEILDRFRAGGEYSAVEFIQAWQSLTRIREEWNSAVAGYDAVITPTTPILPPNIEKLARDHDYYVTENLLALRNTRIANLMGIASLTLPTGLPSTGIMFMTPPHSEERLLRLGAAAEISLA